MDGIPSRSAISGTTAAISVEPAIKSPVSGFLITELSGIQMSFAGVSAGILSHVIIANTDVVLTGLTQAGVATINPDYTVSQVANMYFMIASCVITIVIPAKGRSLRLQQL